MSCLNITTAHASSIKRKLTETQQKILQKAEQKKPFRILLARLSLSFGEVDPSCHYEQMPHRDLTIEREMVESLL